MRRPFWLIDGRLREADFCFDQIGNSRDVFEARCYFSAFLVSFNSTFDAIDRTLRGIDGFAEWWSEREADLFSHSVIVYLRKVRNTIVHEGLNPLQVRVRGGSMPAAETFLDDDEAPTKNVRQLCSHAFGLALPKVAETYQRWWRALDLPDQYSSQDLMRDDLTLESIEMELGLPVGASTRAGRDETERLAYLKRCSKTAVSQLQSKYPVLREASLPCVRDLSMSKTVKKRKDNRLRLAER